MSDDAYSTAPWPYHPCSDISSPTSRSLKRRRIAVEHADVYTEEQQSTLQQAAAILGTSVAGLIAGTQPNASIATSDTDFSTSRDSNFDNLPSEGIVPFKLEFPDFPKKNCASDSSRICCVPSEYEAGATENGQEHGIWPWLSSFPMTNPDPGLESLHEMEILEHPYYNDLELNLVRNPEICEILGRDDLALGSSSSQSLPTADCYDEMYMPTATCYDETYISSHIAPDPSMLYHSGTIPSGHPAPSRPSTSIKHSSPSHSFTIDEDECKQSQTCSPKGEENLQDKVGKPKRRGPFKDPHQRQETELTRSLKACLRCKYQRIRCRPNPSDPTGNCLTCMSVTGLTQSRLPCLRYRITDAQLIDHDTCPRASWSRRWKKMEIVDIKNWRSSEIKEISITQDVCGASYKLKVREFIPIEGDALERKWVIHGEQQSFRCAPYAIANMREAGVILKDFADRHIGPSICYYIDETDKLLRNTYLMAYRHASFTEEEDEKRLLHSVLRLWCASRMESRSDRICGTETLGMVVQFYGRDSPNNGNILLPPVMNAQIEVIVTATILLPMKKEVLKGLQDMILANRPKSWFTVYLCMFILLHSCALLTDADNKKARKQGMQSRFFRTSLIEGLHNGAKILLAHFHYCNRNSPQFTADWTSPEVAERAGLNAEQARFMQDTSEQIKKKTHRFQQVRKEGAIEDELYFLAQLYDEEWKPVHTI